jgi:PAS domain S-box-containing protein
MPDEITAAPTPLHLRLARLLDCTSQPFLILGLDRRVAHANRAFERMLGHEPGALVGVHIDAISPEASRATTRARIERLHAEGTPQRYEKEYLHRDGHRIPVVVATDFDRDEDGAVRGYYAFVTDLSELKAAQEAVRVSEARLRLLAEALLDAVVATDSDARVTLFNPAAEVVFGLPAAEAVGTPLDRLLEADGLPRALREGDPRVIGRTTEARGRRRDGQTVSLEVSVAAVDLGGATEFVLSMRDLSERNRLRALLLRSEKLASIGLLSAGLAHEINNPLAYVANDLAVLERDLDGLRSLIGSLEAAADADEPSRLAARASAAAVAESIDWPYLRDNLPALVRRSREGVRRVSEIVANLRGLARTGPASLEPTALADLIETALEMARPRMARSGIEVRFTHSRLPKIPVVAAQITQVVLNLLVNAVQAIETLGRREGNRIEVRLHAAGDRQMIEVADNGVGIDPDDLPRLFDPFFTTKPVGEGTGLGLALSHGIVAAHGGLIEVESAPGAGALFRIVLPTMPVPDPGRG